MIRLAANLSFLFGELPFLDRFRAASEAGFAAAEFTFVYDLPAGAIAEASRASRLPVVLMNAPPGNLAIGEAGTAALPGREQETRDGFLQAMHYARTIGVPNIHLLAGNIPRDLDPAAAHDAYIDNLRWTADIALKDGVTVTIEPLNALDRPDYFLRNSAQAVAILEEAARPNLRLQLDLYHYRITEGDPRGAIPALLPWIGHVQIAGVPGRHEPVSGGVDQIAALTVLEQAGYVGHVGCEYLPATGTLAGLGWARRYLDPALGVA